MCCRVNEVPVRSWRGAQDGSETAGGEADGREDSDGVVRLHHLSRTTRRHQPRAAGDTQGTPERHT